MNKKPYRRIKAIFYTFIIFCILIILAFLFDFLFNYTLSQQDIDDIMGEKTIIAYRDEGDMLVYIASSGDPNQRLLFQGYEFDHKIFVFSKNALFRRYRLEFSFPYQDVFPWDYRWGGRHMGDPWLGSDFIAGFRRHSIIIFGTISDGLEISIVLDGIAVPRLYMFLLSIGFAIVTFVLWIYERMRKIPC